MQCLCAAPHPPPSGPRPCAPHQLTTTITTTSSSRPQHLRRAGRCRASSAAAAPASPASPHFGLFVCSGSPEMAEAAAASGYDWLCLDAQHGAVPADRLKALLTAAAAGSGGRAKCIVRVGGPTDRFGIQQALDLGAAGVMVPLINSAADAEEAVSYCLYPPAGQRSVAGDIGAVFKRGVGVSVLSQYLREANTQAEVWLQVETRACYEALPEVLAVPGITCAFLGPADLGFGHGLHLKYDFDLPAMMASPEMQQMHANVLKGCQDAGVAPGVFCVGEDQAAALAKQGFTHVAYQTDLGVVVGFAQRSLGKLKAGGASFSI